MLLLLSYTSTECRLPETAVGVVNMVPAAGVVNMVPAASSRSYSVKKAKNVVLCIRVLLFHYIIINKY